jgi:hypothetical protein
MNKKAVSVILFILFALASMCPPSTVYAHNRLLIYEDKEQSNCGQEWEYLFWEGVPSLSIEKIECSPDNKLSLTTVLQPPSSITDAPGQTIWEEAEGKVYFDGEEIGVFEVGDPTYPGGGIDSYSYGEYTYILPWEVTTPVMVKVVIHATTTIEVGSVWRGYPSCYITKQELVEPMSNPSTPISTSTTPGNTLTNRAAYLPPLLGFIGLSIILWIGYQRCGKRLFHMK